VVEGLLVVRAQKEVSWIWRQIERALLKTKIRCIH